MYIYKVKKQKMSEIPKPISQRPENQDYPNQYPKSNGSAEQVLGLSPERISQIASESVFAAHTWILYGLEIPKEKTDGSGGGFTSLFNKGKWVDTKMRKQILQPDRYNQSEIESYKKLMDEFLEAGVSELVTVQVAPEDIKFKQVDPTSSKAEDGVVAIHYKTLTREGSSGKDKYLHLDGFGRPGNTLDLLMYLPKTDGEELISATRRDPNVIRQLVDTQMREQIGANESWNQAKPPYKKWEEINGGVSRIAIRSDNDQGVVASEIVSFKANI